MALTICSTRLVVDRKVFLDELGGTGNDADVEAEHQARECGQNAGKDDRRTCDGLR
jgi:hypothetical protein